MKKFKNGVPMLSKADKAFINNLVEQGIKLDAGYAAAVLYPKHKNRGKSIQIANVYIDKAGSKLFIWYKGYHYCFTGSSIVIPLNLRKKKVVLFYKKYAAYKKKGIKYVPLHLVM